MGFHTVSMSVCYCIVSYRIVLYPWFGTLGVGTRLEWNGREWNVLYGFSRSPGCVFQSNMVVPLRVEKENNNFLSMLAWGVVVKSLVVP